MASPHGGGAFVGACLNYAAWAAWFGGSSRIIGLTGPSLYWSLPILVAAVIWICVVARAPRGVPMHYRAGGAAAGIAATALGCPLGVDTGTLLAFGAFGPVMLFALVLGDRVCAGFGVPGPAAGAPASLTNPRTGTRSEAVEQPDAADEARLE